MTMIGADSVDAGSGATGYLPELREAWRVFVTGDVPDDVLQCEVTVMALFRGSLLLNALTGGAADMTFSARCHQNRNHPDTLLRRPLWRLVGWIIDLACLLTRRETRHCAIAWRNHCARRLAAEAATGHLTCSRQKTRERDDERDRPLLLADAEWLEDLNRA